mgnify:CR=1 FL=1
MPLEFSPAWLVRVFGQPWIYGAFVGYIGAFFTWMSLLKHAPIGPAFAASHLEIITVLATDAGAPDDFAAFCRQTGHVLLESTQAGEIFTLVVQHK